MEYAKAESAGREKEPSKDTEREQQGEGRKKTWDLRTSWKPSAESLSKRKQ